MAENIYLAKISGISGSENLEEYLNGDRSATVVSPNRADYPSKLVEGADFVGIDEEEKQRRVENSSNTAEFASYFFYSDNLEELRHSVITLCNQPVGEDAYDKMMRGESLSRGDLLASDKVSMFVVKTTLDTIQKMVSEGNAEKREGEYFADLECVEKEVLKEIAIGVNGMAELIDNGKVLAFGNLEEVMNRKSLFGEQITEYNNTTSLYPTYNTGLRIENKDIEEKHENNDTANKAVNKNIKELEDYIARLDSFYKSGAISKEDFESFTLEARTQLNTERAKSSGKTTADIIKERIVERNESEEEILKEEKDSYSNDVDYDKEEM